MSNRDSLPTHRIALLATGDEICNGDILNSNAQAISQQLHDLGMHVGIHAAASDNITEIQNTLLFLLQSHQAVIITGGLGPTSDDLTRFALSNVINQPLIFNEAVWENIVTRLKKFGYTQPPECNRQQALFPEHATIIPNPNGTAAGCLVTRDKQLIFMLPGPPSECLPMLNTVVVPTLKQHDFSQISFHKSWMLFGVGEGQIAEKLDALIKPFTCVTGYRIFYPYIEFKLHSYQEKDFNAAIPQIEKLIAPYLISEGKKTASDMLLSWLATKNITLQICDKATGGLLQNTLTTPDTVNKLYFTNAEEFPTFTLSGLQEYWQQQESNETAIKLDFWVNQQQNTLQTSVFNRGERVKKYAVEWACYQIRKILSQSSNN